MRKFVSFINFGRFGFSRAPKQISHRSPSACIIANSLRRPLVSIGHKMEVPATQEQGKTYERNDHSEPETTHGVKRKLSLTVLNLPEKQDKKKFAKFLKEHDVSYSKINKVFGKQFGLIYFENEEQKEDTRKKLDGKELSGRQLRLEEPRENAGLQQILKGEKDQPLKPLPECIEDVVTPWHKIPYEKQLEKKKKEMIKVLKNITQQVFKASNYKIPAWAADKRGDLCCPLEGILASPVTEGYRNKVEFTIGTGIDGKPMIGFLFGRVKDGFFATADPDNCKNVSPVAVKIRRLFQGFIENHDLKPYTKISHSGFWRLLSIRSTDLNEALVTVQVNPTGVSPEQINRVKEDLIELTKKANEESPLITGLHWQEWAGTSNAAPWDCPITRLYGAEFVHERILGLTFRISPSAFFQVNTSATGVLYSLVRDWCGLPALNEDGLLSPEGQKTTLLDICCGTGTIGLTMARQCAKVYGIEVVETAIVDAQANAALNNVTNAVWIAGKAEDELENVISRIDFNRTPNVVGVVDPPRAGLHPKTISAIRRCRGLTRLVYVSCNQSALVNDAATLCRSESSKLVGAPFVPIKAMAVDLFPHTEHTELVMLFERE